MGSQRKGQTQRPPSEFACFSDACDTTASTHHGAPSQAWSAIHNICFGNLTPSKRNASNKGAKWCKIRGQRQCAVENLMEINSGPIFQSFFQFSKGIED